MRGVVRVDNTDRAIVKYTTALGGVVNPQQTVLEGFFHNDTKDMTQQMDMKREGRVTPIRDGKQYLQFQWKTDAVDKTIQEMEKTREFPLYSANYHFSRNRFNQATKVQENWFCKTLHVKDDSISVSDNPKGGVQIPLIYNGNYHNDPNIQEADLEIEPHILWFAGVRGKDVDGEINLQSGSSGAYFNSPYPKSFMVNYDDETGHDP